MPANKKKTVLELCTGGGGQFLGLEQAGFECIGAVEIESNYCETLSFNRPRLNVINEDLKTFNAKAYFGVDLVAGGVPCPPFSVAGKQLGENDERDLFPSALRVIKQVKPKAVILENVPGFASAKFQTYRDTIQKQLSKMGYWSDWKILSASQFGVPQLRPRFVLVALKKGNEKTFNWPTPKQHDTTVGEVLLDLRAEKGWEGAKLWAKKANGIAPTLVGGSKKHGGPDLGPTRARLQWKKLHVNGIGIADTAPGKDFPIDSLPKLTVRMAARIQGFPDTWIFPGRKTTSYRQIGNAFPPAVAQSVGMAITNSLAEI